MTQLPFIGPGTFLIFGIVLVPVYAMLAAWYFGKPIDRTRWRLGVGYVAGITIAMWTGMLVFTLLIGVIFF